MNKRPREKNASAAAGESNRPAAGATSQAMERFRTVARQILAIPKEWVDDEGRKWQEEQRIKKMSSLKRGRYRKRKGTP